MMRGSLGGTIDSFYRSLLWKWIEREAIEGFQLLSRQTWVNAHTFFLLWERKLSLNQPSSSSPQSVCYLFPFH